jgi:hypothetical protein
MEGKPARVGDFLWLQAEIPRTSSTPGDNTISTGFTAGILQYMTECMRSRLEKLSARQVNAKIFMRKPTNTHCIIVCVVGFKTEKSSTTSPSS